MSRPKAPKNFIVASNLILIVFVLSIVYVLLPNISIMAGMLPFSIGMKVAILALALLLRLGYPWSKYILGCARVVHTTWNSRCV